MNLVQRILAENRRTVSSQELADAAEMTHEELLQLLREIHLTDMGFQFLQVHEDGCLLTSAQALVVIYYIPIIPDVPSTPARLDLLESYVQVLSMKLTGLAELLERIGIR